VEEEEQRRRSIRQAERGKEKGKRGNTGLEETIVPSNSRD